MEVKRAEPRDSKSQAPGQPGASQWGSRVVPSAANGWAGQPPPTWQQGYGPQGKAGVPPDGPIHSWDAPTATRAGCGGRNLRQGPSLSRAGWVCPVCRPRALGVLGWCLRRRSEMCLQGQVPRGRSGRWTWLTVSQALVGGSGESGVSTQRGGSMASCLLSPLGLFQLPGLWALRVGLAELLRTALRGGLGWPGAPSQDPGASIPFRNLGKEHCPGKGTGRPQAHRLFLHGSRLYSWSLQGWLLEWFLLQNKPRL